MAHPSASAPCSATKSSTTCAPRPPVSSRTAPACVPSATTVWSAPIWAASLSASGLRSTTMIVVAVSAARHWTPMWPRPPAPITTAGVPVAERVGQRGVHRRIPLPLDDVQVGAADAGPADLDDNVERALDGRLGHLVDDGLLMVTMDPDSLHWAPLSSSGACPRPAESYLCRR